MNNISREIARKVVQTVDAGLCSGIGTPTPGNMCVEAAVCYAQGLPHGDNPTCVGSAVRAFKITLNDAPWSSKDARALGLRRIAVAQLGSDEVAQTQFAILLAIKTVQQIVPLALRAAGKLCLTHTAELELAALACEVVTTLAAAESAATWAESAAKSAAKSAAESAATWAAKSATWAAESAGNFVFTKMAAIGVEVLQELGCKGCEWLNECD